MATYTPTMQVIVVKLKPAARLAPRSQFCGGSANVTTTAQSSVEAQDTRHTVSPTQILARWRSAFNSTAQAAASKLR